jgi:hypothetical protein
MRGNVGERRYTLKTPNLRLPAEAAVRTRWIRPEWSVWAVADLVEATDWSRHLARLPPDDRNPADRVKSLPLPAARRQNRNSWCGNVRSFRQARGHSPNGRPQGSFEARRIRDVLPRKRVLPESPRNPPGAGTRQSRTQSRVLWRSLCECLMSLVSPSHAALSEAYAGTMAPQSVTLRIKLGMKRGPLPRYSARQER